jgi:regulatory protein
VVRQVDAHEYVRWDVAMTAFARTNKKKQPLSEDALFEYAVGALARKMRTVRDLKKLMRQRVEEGDPGERIMDRVVARLKELKYLSDARFAEDYTRLRRDNEKYGSRRVQQGLVQRGVHKDVISATIEKEYGEVDELALAREYVARKRIKQPEGEDAKKQAARIMGRLQRAGFSAGVVFKLLRSWEIEIEETDADQAAMEEDTEP